MSLADLEQNEKLVMKDLFDYFARESDYPPATAFEIGQKKLGRIKALDALLHKGPIRSSGDKYEFDNRRYLGSKWGKADLDIVAKLVPIISEMYERKQEGLHPVFELEAEMKKANLPPLPPLVMQRVLQVMRWIGLVGGYSDAMIDGRKGIGAFQISRQILRCDDLTEYLDKYYPQTPKSIGSSKNIIAGDIALAGLIGPDPKKAPVSLNFETTFNDYARLEVIGNGANGQVFKAKDSDGNFVAIKLLDIAKATKEKLKRFKNEIWFCKKTSHANIINVLDDGLYNDGETRSPFYVMPLHEKSLRKLMQGKIPASDILPLFAGILDGIETAHYKEVVHRDLKPENILYNATGGRLVVADFGIAQFEEEDLYTAVETRDQQRMANFLYAAPEQKQRGAIMDARTDIFALGLILNELFTGEVPAGPGYRPISTVAPEFSYLDSIVEKMIQQNPASRYSNIGEIKSDLLRRGNEFIIKQRVSELEGNEVVAENLPDDPILKDPPKIVSVDYEDGVLKLIFSQPLPQKWISALHSMGSYEYIQGKGPQAFTFNGATASIGAKNLAQSQGIINHFKNWIPMAQVRYENMIMSEIQERERRAKDEIQRKLSEEKKRLEILKNLKF